MDEDEYSARLRDLTLEAVEDGVDPFAVIGILDTYSGIVQREAILGDDDDGSGSEFRVDGDLR